MICGPSTVNKYETADCCNINTILNYTRPLVYEQNKNNIKNIKSSCVKVSFPNVYPSIRQINRERQNKKNSVREHIDHANRIQRHG